MTLPRDPAQVQGPEPKRATYEDGAYGSEEQGGQSGGSSNVGASYAPGSVRTGGNIALGIFALVAFLALIGLYALFLSLR